MEVNLMVRGISGNIRSGFSNQEIIQNYISIDFSRRNK